MKHLFFDTETTGLPKSWSAPVEDMNNWPRLIQLAWVLCDRSGTILEKSDQIIWPEGFTIPKEASIVHGITQERACREGRMLQPVLAQFNAVLAVSDVLVGHNISFDEKIVGAEFVRMKMPNVIPNKKRICTMMKSTSLCKLRGPYGYKWPKLQELHRHLFGKDFKEAHNAAADIQATVTCFWEMRRRGIV